MSLGRRQEGVFSTGRYLRGIRRKTPDLLVRRLPKRRVGSLRVRL